MRHMVAVEDQRGWRWQARRRLRLVVGLLAASLTLVACGGATTGEPAAEQGPTGPASATEAGTASPAAFPVTVEHTYGETTIPSAPERVAVVGLVEQDALLALGVVPVATTEWFGDQPGAVFPWAEDELGDAEPPEVVGTSQEYDMERIAALQPDVILGLYSGLTQKQYDRLSQIAPTVAQPGDHVDYGIPWQELTRTVGRVVGKQDRAEELIGEIEDRFATVRETHPEFDGATGVFTSTFGDNAYSVYGPQDARARLLSSLGVHMPEEIAEAIDTDAFYTEISDERLSLIGGLDLVIWFVPSQEEAQQEVRDNPLYQNLAVAQQGRDVILAPEDPAYDAINFSTVLSLPFALERLVPMLEAAVDGDPATEPAPAS